VTLARESGVQVAAVTGRYDPGAQEPATAVFRYDGQGTVTEYIHDGGRWNPVDWQAPQGPDQLVGGVLSDLEPPVASLDIAA
jgi:hypothetical protein